MIDPILFELARDLEKISKAKNKKKRILFFGRDTFTDNSKYLFLYMQQRYKDFDVVWGSFNDKLTETLVTYNIPCVPLNKDLKMSSKYLLDVAIAVFCVNPNDALKSNFVLSSCLKGAVTVQLWHGIGVKKIDLATTGFRDITNINISKSLCGAISADYYLSPSEYVDGNWQEFFGARQIIRGGYPRNEVLLRDATHYEMIDAELGQNVHELLYQKENKKILLAPTWVQNSGLNKHSILSAIGKYAQSHNVSIFLKPHPFVPENQLISIAGIHYIPAYLDIYPHLKQFDAMVTDYSSIIFDYLLLDKPILTVDIEQGADFDYSMLPTGDGFRYSFNAKNVADVFDAALNKDNKHSARQQLAKYIFPTDNYRACAEISEKIIHLYEKYVAQKGTLEII